MLGLGINVRLVLELRLVRVREVPWARRVQVRVMLGLCTNRVKDNVSGTDS